MNNLPSKRCKDLTGQIFNKLTVIEFSHIDKQGNTCWICLCECGNSKSIVAYNLKTNNVKSCGCLFKLRTPRGAYKKRDTPTKQKDKQKNIPIKQKDTLIGQKFGKLTVIERSGFKEYGKKKMKLVVWKCACDCGGEKYTLASSLRNGSTKSCGCLISPQTPRGELHPRWNHNKTYEERLKSRRFTELPIWRKQVFERDNYTCQISGINGNVNAHHIFNWADNPDKRFNLENGITLNIEIHKLFHSLYGKKGNNLDQYLEFKQRYLAGEFNNVLKLSN